MEVSQDFGQNTTSSATFSNSIQLYGNNGTDYKDVLFNFPEATQTQKNSVVTFLETVKNTRPFVLFIWEDDLAIQAPIYFSITEYPVRFPRRQTLGGLIYSFQLQGQECK